MLTRNFYSLIGTVPGSTTTVKGTLPVTDGYGFQYFLTGQFYYPRDRWQDYTADTYTSGITLGSGTTPPKVTDYRIEAPHNSGLSVTITARNVEPNDGEPYLQYDMTVTNTSGSEKVLAEIGYKQNVRATRFSGDTSGLDVSVLMDRTLIDPPITLSDREATVIHYRIKTTQEERYVNGVKMVSWQYGSDEDVAAMIDAAREGTIDLQDDGWWQVGDMRPTTIGEFTAGGVTNEEQTIDLVITSFDEYNGSGSIMQVDFAEELATGVRVNSTNTNTGGYGATEMYTTTLPALFDAMPQWIRDEAIEFSVLASEGSNSATIETVTGNRLALRSEMEIYGSNGSGSKPGEGTAVPWYQSHANMRIKRRGRAGGNSTYSLRSPAGNTTQFVGMYTNGNSQTVNPTGANGLAPFLCL